MHTGEALEVREAAALRARSHPSRPGPQEVEDIAQEVVLRYLRQEPGSITNPAAWANTVAGNLCMTFASRRARNGPLPEEDDARHAVEHFITRGKPTSYAAMLRQHSAAILAALTPRERELIQLVAEGTPQADIAEIMGFASADSVKVTLSRLRRKAVAAGGRGGRSADWQEHPRPY